MRLKAAILSFFGRGEELEVLAQHQIPFSVVPGITAGIGAMSHAGKFHSTVIMHKAPFCDWSS